MEEGRTQDSDPDFTTSEICQGHQSHPSHVFLPEACLLGSNPNATGMIFKSFFFGKSLDDMF